MVAIAQLTPTIGTVRVDAATAASGRALPARLRAPQGMVSAPDGPARVAARTSDKPSTSASCPPSGAQSVFTDQVPQDDNRSDAGQNYELGLRFQTARPGQITAIRYWRSPGDTGSHVGNLWADGGASPLASVAFAGESASGWQQQGLPQPLTVAANTVYVVSVNANTAFPHSLDALSTTLTSAAGDLRTVADGANGLYGSPGALPTGSYRASNYFRDVVFVPAGCAAPPTATSTVVSTATPAPAPIVTNTPIAIASGTPAGASTGTPVATNMPTMSAASTPTPMATPLATATSGPAATTTAAAVGTTNPIPTPTSPTGCLPLAPESVFTDQVPQDDNRSDAGQNYELGLRFQTARPGQITAIRYWRSPGDTGSHVGNLWADGGASPLASVAFAGESASGWQQQGLPQPLTVAANTVYVVSVNANTAFPHSLDALSTTLTSAAGDLRTVADGANGLYGSPGALPTGSYRASNYFRDVVFVPAGCAAPPTATSTVVSTATSTSTSSPTRTPTTTPTQTPTTTSTRTPTMIAARTPIATPTRTRTPIAAPTRTPTARPTTTITSTATPTASAVNSPTASSTVIPTATNTVIPTATNTVIPTATNTPTPFGCKPLGTQSVFTDQTPNAANVDNAGLNTELGLKFQSGRAGQITAIRYWRSPGDTGAHVGNIWLGTGGTDPLNIAPLTTVTFTNETAAGWQQQALPQPLAIAANTVYIVSVNANAYFPASGGALLTSVANGNLRTVADYHNGVSGSTGAFPTDDYQNTNYFRDVVFVPAGCAGTPTPTATPSATPSATPIPPATTNPIYLENQKPGTTAWQITDQAGSEISGYAGATSVNRGGSLAIKVSVGNPGSGQYTTASPGSYRLDVYRLGYYGGAGGRLVASNGPLSGVTQPACGVTDPATRLVECKWPTSYTLAVGSAWTSGLYVGKLTDGATGKQAQVFFVVRDDSSTSNVLFQSSFNTFEAYNTYGGYSLYDNLSTGNQRAYKVSFDRPFVGSWNSMLRWERNMVRWMESQGYDVSYVTNVDVSTNPALLRQHKVFLSVGHDEYWSMEERNAVRSARDAGVNLGFFSANAGYWRARYEPSSGGAANRVIVCYKDAWAQDTVAPTNQFRSPQNNMPENALLGVMYIGDRSDLYAGYPYVVSNSGDRSYANTGLKNGDALTGLVGYEWDGVVDNGSTPSGLVVLSQSPVVPDDVSPEMPWVDTQVASAARYTAASGAHVFAVGSIQWAWGLDSDGVAAVPRVDARARQFAVNVLADLGARPLTPAPGLIVP